MRSEYNKYFGKLHELCLIINLVISKFNFNYFNDRISYVFILYLTASQLICM